MPTEPDQLAHGLVGNPLDFLRPWDV